MRCGEKDNIRDIAKIEDFCHEANFVAAKFSRAFVVQRKPSHDVFQRSLLTDCIRQTCCRP